ncbi:hypothetical protein [Burkholderia ubonensis]|uniref:hypothetical protein n=1 Tax=Burkholderia ubonensis TaxID=101571 RepID=UPI00075973A5|nr:hypothetical protein [Burkholderia ubonensis]KWK68841.1 hypothetical protein WM15_06520 [Burkholderia ubonensis]
MQRTYAYWHESAVDRFSGPLTDAEREATLAALAAGLPVVIDETVLKLETCEWPSPAEFGFQIFGRNAQHVEMADVIGLDHPQPLMPSKLMEAIAWAEMQATHPAMHPEP